MRAFLTISILIAVGTGPVLTQSNASDICKQYELVPLPSEASVSTPTEFPACESYKSYAGIGRPVNYEAARACAWRDRAAARLQQNPKAPVAWFVGGSLILTDLYANGLGTPRNPKLAMRLACEQEDAYVGQAFQLLSARITNGAHQQEHYELCDYGGSTFSMNFCESYKSQAEDSKRALVFDTLSTHWSKSQKTAFAAAYKAFDHYVELTGRDQTYQGGTIRVLRSLGAMEQMQRDFLASLQAYESGKLPHSSAATFKLRDSELNRVYEEALRQSRETVASDNFTPEEEIQPEGIRKTERAWLAYRDAWVAFAVLRYPSVPREAWLDELTEARVHRLLLLVCDTPDEKLCTPAIRKEVEALE